MMLRGGALAQAGRNADVIGGHVGEQDLLLLDGALADESFAQLESSCRRVRGGW